MKLTELREFADHLAEEPDQDYKDEWERGFDAGRMTAGRELQKLLRTDEPTEAEVDREALRIANSGRDKSNKVQMLDSLNPQARLAYRHLARVNLWEAE